MCKIFSVIFHVIKTVLIDSIRALNEKWSCCIKDDKIDNGMMLSAGLGYVAAPGSGSVSATTPSYSPSPPARHSPLPSFGFTQEQVACVCEVSAFDGVGKWFSMVSKPLQFLIYVFVTFLV